MDDAKRGLTGGGPPDGGDSWELLPPVYSELRRLATVQMAREAQGQTLQATALVHEVWLRLAGKNDRRWENPAHFYGAASQAMRRILIENARRKARLRHGGSDVRVAASVLETTPEQSPEDKVLMIESALRQLETIHPERAEVVVRKFFGGLTNAEVAQSLGISERSVDRHWACAKAWLFLHLRKGR